VIDSVALDFLMKFIIIGWLISSLVRVTSQLRHVLQAKRARESRVYYTSLHITLVRATVVDEVRQAEGATLISQRVLPTYNWR
jgi:hypothetical protein